MRASLPTLKNLSGSHLNNVPGLALKINIAAGRVSVTQQRSRPSNHNYAKQQRTLLSQPGPWPALREKLFPCQWQ